MPTPGPGQVLLRNRWLSLDPYMRGRMEEGPSYAAPVAVDAVMEGRTVSEVIASNHPGIAVGAQVVATGNWQTHAVVDGDSITRTLDDTGLPVSTALGVYGMPGFTAYAGLQEIGRLQPGETLVVAAASGPVGATVGQIAKLQGARTVGIAGGEQKRRYLETLGFDVALDHRADDFAAQLRAAVPNGIDVYFENVGGHVFEAVVPLLNDFARIPVCGTIATYNARGAVLPGPDRLPGFMSQVLRQRLTGSWSTWRAGCRRAGCSTAKTSSRAWRRHRRHSSACSRGATSASWWLSWTERWGCGQVRSSATVLPWPTRVRDRRITPRWLGWQLSP